MSYRKWSVPEEMAAKIDRTAHQLGFTKRGERWKMLDWILEYIKLHPDLFHKR